MRDDDAARLLAPLPGEERYATWHLAEPDGRLLDRGAASIRLLEHLGWDTVAEAVAPAERLVTAAYELIARHRSRLGQLVPDGFAPHDFP